jgi:hypothetical protein
LDDGSNILHILLVSGETVEILHFLADVVPSHQIFLSKSTNDFSDHVESTIRGLLSDFKSFLVTTSFFGNVETKVSSLLADVETDFGDTLPLLILFLKIRGKSTHKSWNDVVGTVNGEHFLLHS